MPNCTQWKLLRVEWGWEISFKSWLKTHVFHVVKIHLKTKQAVPTQDDLESYCIEISRAQSRAQRCPWDASWLQGTGFISENTKRFSGGTRGLYFDGERHKNSWKMTPFRNKAWLCNCWEDWALQQGNSRISTSQKCLKQAWMPFWRCILVKHRLLNPLPITVKFYIQLI